MTEGLSNSEIARRLHITHGTAKTHVGHLLNSGPATVCNWWSSSTAPASPTGAHRAATEWQNSADLPGTSWGGQRR
ncbi:LuxR C-terminal-related transcriptional regulator [Streptomyces sp. NY05-11A]|uniref:LuxR C-terminal-related transcriptional regulator n=1 Tax=Streptomyces soliscabiei TaxID=588897 RepID=UPI0039F6818F